MCWCVCWVLTAAFGAIQRLGAFRCERATKPEGHDLVQHPAGSGPAGDTTRTSTDQQPLTEQHRADHSHQRIRPGCFSPIKTVVTTATAAAMYLITAIN
ncbi:unnamed protein product [Boreogadus saida]